MATNCPSDAALAGYIDGSASDAVRGQLETHIDTCVDCRELLAALARKGASTAGELRGGSERYEILEQIGAGAMGAVYVARDLELDRKVALKILHPGDASPIGETVTVTAGNAGGMLSADRDRLRKEARALAKLSHPNIVQIYDVGEMDGEVFIAMELVVGKNLREWLAADATRPWTDVLEVFEAAGRGLAAAHGAGIVHRDFKPDNVLVADNGRVTVTDFGLAKQALDPGCLGDGARDVDLASAQTIKQDTTVAGTPAYMAPELFMGRPADAASDQYSFCVALHEALYKQRPTVGGPEPVPTGTLPRWLHAIIVRGLDKNSEARFPDVPSMLRKIERGRQGSRRLRLGAAATLGAIALVGGAVWVGAATATSSDDRPPTNAPVPADAAPRIDAAPKLTLAQIQTEINKARTERKKRKNKAAMARLDKVQPLIDPPKTANETLTLAKLLSLRCRVWFRLKNRNAGITDCLRAIKLNTETLGSEHASVIRDTVTTAIYLKQTQRWAEAEPMLKRGLELSRKHTPNLYGNIFILMSDLGQTYASTKRPKLAVPLLLDAVTYFEQHDLRKTAAAFVTLHVAVYERLSLAQWDIGHKKQARASARKALAVSTPRVNKAVLTRIRTWLKVHE